MSLPKKVLVVGGKGKVGEWLVRVCRSLGDEVTVCDRDNAGDLESLAADAEVAIVAVPPRSAPRTVAKLIASMPAEGLIVDVTSLKTSVAVAAVRANPTQSVALVHPMCAPPRDGLSIGDAAIVLCEEQLAASGPSREWYDRLVAAIGGRRFRMSAVEHDRVDVPLQPGAHALLVAFAAEMAATLEPLSRFEELAPPVAGSLIQAVRRFLGSGNPDVFAWLQVEAAQTRHNVTGRMADTLKKIGEAAAKGSVADLRQTFLDLREKLEVTET